MSETSRMKLGALVIVSGPSGAGKSTVCGDLLTRMPDIHFSISCTTRAPRGAEVDGVDYHFLTVEAFKEKIANGEFLEWAEVHGNYYGTLVSEVAPRILAGEDVILDIDVQGQAQVVSSIRSYKEWGGALVSVFLGPPSLAVLEQRLRGRKTDSEEAIVKRLGNARCEMEQWRHYDYVIVNHDSECASRELEAIIVAAHCRTATQQGEPWNE